MGTTEKINVLILHSSQFLLRPVQWKCDIYLEYNSHVGEMPVAIWVPRWTTTRLCCVSGGKQIRCNAPASGFSPCWCHWHQFCVCLCLFESPTGMESSACTDSSAGLSRWRVRTWTRTREVFTEGESGLLKEERASHTFSFMPTPASLNLFTSSLHIIFPHLYICKELQKIHCKI